MIAEMAWEMVDLAIADANVPVAIGGSAAPHRILEAMRHAAYPLPCDPGYPANVNRALYEDYVIDGMITTFPGETCDPYELTWWCPPSRPAIRVGDVHLSTTLRRHLRNKHPWVTSCDHAFADVIDGCRTQRDTRWITDELRASMLALHEAGWAHSIEVWDGDELIAGTFGIGIGHVFSLDSAFCRRNDATKVAIADLSRRLVGRATLIDVQAPSGYTAALGATPITREEFLATLMDVDLPLVPQMGVLPVAPLGE